MDIPAVDILAFDVFGTVVDWHGSIAREVDAMGLPVSGSEFALAWRAGYAPAMRRVMAGELPWSTIDALHRMILDELLARFRIDGLDESAKDHLNRAWHRLDPWPDAVAGIARLKTRFVAATLSNGNIALLTHMARHAGLPWDCILSAEIFRRYKPHPDTYLGVARVFGVPPERVMLVAAHHDDLAGARACGLRTAYIERPLEFGTAQPKDVSPRPGNDLHARNLLHLADMLGC